MSQTKVLILASPEDAHALSVVYHLRRMDAKVDLFRFEDFIQRSSLHFEIGTGKRVCRIQRDQDELDMTSYLSVWRRRPGSFRAGSFVEAWISGLIESESQSAMSGIFQSMHCIWMNFPLNDMVAMDKLHQLQLAESIGFNIPETIVTNQPESVLKFFEQCDGKVIYKLIGELSGFSMPKNETPSGISTQPLRKLDLPFLEQVIHGPHLFQRSVSKGCDLRVTIAGRQVFCTRIDSQAGAGAVDWRNDYTVPMYPFDLPDEIESRCLELMRRLKLNYGAIDMVLTENQEYFFLEINCAGQYLWAEERSKQPISEAIASVLTGRAEPLVHPSH